MQLDYESAYMEISAMSKALRQSIKHMPKYYRYNIGDRIINLLLDIKLCVKLLYKGRNSGYTDDDLYNMLVKLGVLIDDCIEEKALLIKGEYNVIEPRERLRKLFMLFEGE